MDWDAIEAKIEQAAQEQAEAKRQQISERRAAHRARKRRRKIAQIVGAAAALALGASIVAAAATAGSREPTPSAPSDLQGPEPTATAYIPPTESIVLQAAPSPAPAPPPEPEQPAKLLESVPLDAETQAAIFDLCGQDPELFCAVMAIAWRESRFRSDVVGDSGVSKGMYQINTRWHTERMKKLGVTDLTDPVQCTAVALDYLRELSTRYGFGWVHDNTLFMGYNAGPSRAQRMLRNGVTSTAYSRETIALMETYLAEMGAAK